MKLLFVIQRYGIEVDGGAELYCRWLAEHCIEDHDITVLTTTARDYLTWSNFYQPGEEYINGIRVIRCLVSGERDIQEFNLLTEKLLSSDHSVSDEAHWVRSQGPWSPNLLGYIHNHHAKYDSIVFFTYLYAPTVFGARIAPSKSILISTAHDEPVAHLEIIRKLYSQVSGLLFLTPDEQTFVTSCYPVKNTPALLLGTGVDIPESRITEAEISLKYNLVGNIILYIGRVEEGKGCRDLIDSFREYRDNSRNGATTLVLAGRIHMDVVEDPDIRFTGFVADEEIAPLLEVADVIVVPSPFESLSILLLQAFKKRKPVIVNGLSPVLKGHCTASNGGLYYFSKEELVASLSLILERRDLRENLGENGSHYVQETYQWDKVRHTFRKFLNSLNQ